MKRTTKRFARHTLLAGQKRGTPQREATEDHLAVYGLLRALSLSCDRSKRPSWRLLMRLWRNQAFAVFWPARTISFTGTGITIVVMPVLVYEMTHSPAWVASLSLIRAPGSRPLTLIAETMCHGVAETELAIRWRPDSVGLVAETELAITHWPDDAAVPDVGRHV